MSRQEKSCGFALRERQVAEPRHRRIVLNNTNRDEAQWRLATLHVIDMQGEMDIEVDLVTPQRSDFEGRVCSGVLPAGLYTTLTQ